MIKNTRESYGVVSQFFHWLVFFLACIMFPLGYLMGEVHDAILRGEVYNSHKLLGIVILLIMLLRMLWRIVNPKPAMPVGATFWEVGLAHAGHFSLYILLLAMPLSGWIMSVAAGRAPHYLHWTLTLPLDPSKTVASVAARTHGVLAWVILIMVALHVLAAFYHHFIKKDNVLKRMLVR